MNMLMAKTMTGRRDGNFHDTRYMHFQLGGKSARGFAKKEKDLLVSASQIMIDIVRPVIPGTISFNGATGFIMKYVAGDGIR